VWRWLNEDAIRPWRHRAWIFPRDPEFAVKAGRILDLYARQWEGKPLKPEEFVICADEKTSIQARIRKHPTLPRVRASLFESNTSTRAAAPGPTWPRSTSTTQSSSAAVRKRLAACPSIASSPKS